jgi:hypothetical protein
MSRSVPPRAHRSTGRNWRRLFRWISCGRAFRPRGVRSCLGN